MPRHHKSIPHERYEHTSVCKSKRRFASENEIQEHIVDREFETPQVELGYYQCIDCDGWHLTRVRQSEK